MSGADWLYRHQVVSIFDGKLTQIMATDTAVKAYREKKIANKTHYSFIVNYNLLSLRDSTSH